MLNTRLRRWAQVMARWRCSGVFSSFSFRVSPLPRLAGVTSTRCWVTCVSYAMVAGLIFRMIVMPESELAEVATAHRIAAVAIAFAAYFLLRRRLVAGVLAGGLSLSAMAAWLS